MSFLAFGNDDLTNQVEGVLTTQLRLSEIISLDEFNARFAAVPDYPLIIHQNDIHLLVIGSYYNLVDRSPFDFCLFFKAGLVYIESRHCGIPGFSCPIARLTIAELRHHFPRCDFDDGYCGQDIQNNILYPLDRKITDPQAFPFGEWEEHQKGNPFHLPIQDYNLFATSAHGHFEDPDIDEEGD